MTRISNTIGGAAAEEQHSLLKCEDQASILFTSLFWNHLGTGTVQCHGAEPVSTAPEPAALGAKYFPTSEKGLFPFHERRYLKPRRNANFSSTSSIWATGPLSWIKRVLSVSEMRSDQQPKHGENHGQAGLVEEADTAVLEEPDGEDGEGEQQDEGRKAGLPLGGSKVPAAKAEGQEWVPAWDMDIGSRGSPGPTSVGWCSVWREPLALGNLQGETKKGQCDVIPEYAMISVAVWFLNAAGAVEASRQPAVEGWVKAAPDPSEPQRPSPAFSTLRPRFGFRNALPS
ncbi:hypothetical protein Anapl_12534 [Anas platyrhynchos]|uniref:Uncharacterized protein n=1 Tax=Anas platyrhynchos TaxID=8839 RepID=R0JSB7_ANAPL|nr:hypothetical protein Anapl_12534 [Anas platyrhynchos]